VTGGEGVVRDKETIQQKEIKLSVERDRVPTPGKKGGGRAMKKDRPPRRTRRRYSWRPRNQWEIALKGGGAERKPIKQKGKTRLIKKNLLFPCKESGEIVIAKKRGRVAMDAKAEKEKII